MALATRTLEQQFADEFPNSRARAMHALEIFPSGVTHDGRYVKPFPLYVQHAQGSKKYDVDGHELIDYAVGHGSLILGHGRPEIIAAVEEQLHKGTHYGAGHDLELAWGDWVTRLVPSVDTVRFTGSGTESTLMAMRLARAYTGREKIVKVSGNFHGWHDAALPGEKVPFDVVNSPGVPQGTVESVSVAPVNDLDWVAQRCAQGDIAGLILEPSGASWATIPLPEGYLAGLREITNKHEVVLIFDEVITGFRWAPGGAQERYNVIPDITTMAKIVAGGLPGGAVGGRGDIMALLEFRDDPAWKKVPHPGTFNANPLSAAAGSTCLEIVSNPEIQRHCDALAATLRAGCNALLVERSIPGVVYGESSVFHVLLGESPSNMTNGDLRAPEGLTPERLKTANTGKVKATLNAGMLLNGVDLFSNGGLFSYAHTPDDVDKTLEAFDTTICRMRDEGVIG